MRTLVAGDIHGNLPALEQALERAHFDPGADRLISLGDVYNGHPYSAECVELLMGVEDLVWCLGNHDALALTWLRGVWETEGDYAQWSLSEIDAVVENYGGVDNPDRALMKRHADFMERTAVPYFIDEADRLYVHAGIDWNYPVDGQPDRNIYYTDRKTYAEYAIRHEKKGTRFPYKDVFIGHTKTLSDSPEGKPVRRANLWNLDTGAGTYGKITVMDAATYVYWQSDWSQEYKP